MNLQKNKLRTAMLAVPICSLMWLTAQPPAPAQDCHGGPPPPDRAAGASHRPPPDGPSPGYQDSLHGPPPGPGDGTQSTMRGGLQLGPPGRWWDDKEFAQELGLSAAQARRMDGIFQANRSTLLDLYRSLQQQESILERLTTGARLNERKNLPTDRSSHHSPSGPGKGKRPHAIADSNADDRRTNREAGPASSETAKLKPAGCTASWAIRRLLT